ncbi:hypothetical protein GTU99_21260 [Streptomyces sp. PRKS01-65]|nr:hypothetical protein [Streptomyces harenosi]NEY34697.1 hypothetical protein [Streptomyces harenosi]
MSDPEIGAMSAIAGALHDLEEGAQGRVLRWAAERYGVTLSSPATRNGLKGASEPEEEVDRASDEETTAEAPKFEHFAELFHAAAPKTDVDRALVAGYWFQAILGNAYFQSAALNKELKNLGHGLKNVTESLKYNQEKKPARVIQLRKMGNSRQGRKQYKLTHEGLVYVQRLIGTES